MIELLIIGLIGLGLFVAALLLAGRSAGRRVSLEEEARCERRRIAQAELRARRQIDHLTHAAFDEMLGEAQRQRGQR